jgi:hypothetical protein
MPKRLLDDDWKKWPVEAKLLLLEKLHQALKAKAKHRSMVVWRKVV